MQTPDVRESTEQEMPKAWDEELQSDLWKVLEELHLIDENDIEWVVRAEELRLSSNEHSKLFILLKERHEKREEFRAATLQTHRQTNTHLTKEQFEASCWQLLNQKKQYES
jgi:hypothetical protein